MREGTSGRAGVIASLAAGVLGFIASTVPFSETAAAHPSSHDSVDGCEIRDEDETSWDTERIAARNIWEAEKNIQYDGDPDPDNCVNIAHDIWSTSADLEWKNANRSDVDWAGRYEWELGADDIKLNTFYLNTYSSCRRKNVAMHELGHAHGWNHSYPPNVMYRYTQNICTLGAHDRIDYHLDWG